MTFKMDNLKIDTIYGRNASCFETMTAGENDCNFMRQKSDERNKILKNPFSTSSGTLMERFKEVQGSGL